MKTSIIPHQQRKGLTLVELTIVMVIGLTLSAATMSLFSNQMSMFSVLRTQNFLLRNAPQINAVLNKIIPRANNFQMFDTAADVDVNANGVIANASVLALRFQKTTVAAQGDTTLDFTYSVIVFDSTTGDLNYYNGLASPADLNPLPANPSWRIASGISNVVFSVVDGVISTQITGGDGEQITFYSTTRN